MDVVINVNIGNEEEGEPKVKVTKRKLKNGKESIIKLPDTQPVDKGNAILQGLGL